LAKLVEIERRGDVAVVTLREGQSNALTARLRAALHVALHDLFHQPECLSIVLRGAGAMFSAGADFSEYNGSIADPTVGALARMIEDAPKPVVCALHGQAIGAAFELALAAPMRVAQQDTRVAFSDIKLRLIPGAGGTQRLPRLLGAQASLELMLSGRMRSVSDAKVRSLFAVLSKTDPTDSAVAHARLMARSGVWRRSCDITKGLSDPTGFLTTIASVRRQLPSQNCAEADLVNCVERAQLLPFEQGLAFEETVFEARRMMPEARGMRHALVSERRARGAAVQAPPKRIYVLGGNQLSCETAALMLNGAAQVVLHAADPVAAEGARATVQQLLKARFQGASLQHRLNRFEVRGNMSLDGQGDLILDGTDVPPSDVGALKSETIWAGLRPDMTPQRSGGAVGPERFVNLWLHRPIGEAGVVELANASGVASDVVARIAGLMGQLEHNVIETRLRAGVLGHRLHMAVNSAACLLVAHGADPYEVDHAAGEVGFGVSPFVAMDRIGLVATISQLSQFAQARHLVDVSQGMLQALCDKGRTGRGAGRGLYSYGVGGPTRDPVVPHVAKELLLSQKAKALKGHELGAALLGAFANEAARLITEDAVASAYELDLFALKAMRFDRMCGGPLLKADHFGIFRLCKVLDQVSDLSDLWEAHGRLVMMYKNGQGFFERSTAERGPDRVR